MLRIAFVEWPEGLLVDDSRWDVLKRSLALKHPDMLVTNELPFGPWLAEKSDFSEEDANRSISAHATGIAGLNDLGIPSIISSRPVWNGERLANEAFVLENGTVCPLHRKQYFPDEPGWFEGNWYAGDASGFTVAEILGVKVGVLLCTEAMFNEHARAYGRQRATLIVLPRATGLDVEPWKIAGSMASLVSGAYVVSSNRVGSAIGGTHFGGGGFACAPQGKLLAITGPADPIQILDLDPNLSASAQRSYPCYVQERDG